MIKISVITPIGEEWLIHRYQGGSRVKPDSEGKVTGYRVTPGSNLSSEARSFERLEDAAQFLLANPSWGARFSPGGKGSPQNIFVKEIEINGARR